MKNINYVLIEPELGLWSQEGNARVRDESRSLGCFLALELKKQKIKSDRFDCIYFKGVSLPQKVYYANNLMGVEVHFPETSYASKGDIQGINEYLVGRLQAGLELIKDEYPEIVNILLQGIHNFRAVNYQCNWIHKQKKLKNSFCVLRCALNTEKFNLFLDVLDHQKNVVFSKLILETPPNEFSFKHHFKDLVIENEHVFVTDHFDKRWFELNMNEVNII